MGRNVFLIWDQVTQFDFHHFGLDRWGSAIHDYPSPWRWFLWEAGFAAAKTTSIHPFDPLSRSPGLTLTGSRGRRRRSRAGPVLRLRWAKLSPAGTPTPVCSLMSVPGTPPPALPHRSPGVVGACPPLSGAPEPRGGMGVSVGETPAPILVDKEHVELLMSGRVQAILGQKWTKYAHTHARGAEARTLDGFPFEGQTKATIKKCHKVLNFSRNVIVKFICISRCNRNREYFLSRGANPLIYGFARETHT